MTNQETMAVYAAALTKELGVEHRMCAEGDGAMIEIDGWIYVEQGSITLQHCSVLGTKVEDVPGFIVSAITVTPGCFDYPDDADVSEVGQYRVMTDALIAAYMIALKNRADQVVESAGNALYFSDMASGRNVESV